MTARFIAAFDPSDFKRNNLVAEHAGNPLNRAHEGDSAAITPTHRFGPRQVGNQLRNHLGEDLDGRPTSLCTGADNVLAFSPLDFFAAKLAELDAILSCESLGGLGWRSRFVKGHSRRGAHHQFGEVSLVLGKLFYEHRDPPRGSDGLRSVLRSPFKAKSAFLQHRVEAATEIAKRTSERRRWNLFGSDFEDEVKRHRQPRALLVPQQQRLH